MHRVDTFHCKSHKSMPAQPEASCQSRCRLLVKMQNVKWNDRWTVNWVTLCRSVTNVALLWIVFFYSCIILFKKKVECHLESAPRVIGNGGENPFADYF